MKMNVKEIENLIKLMEKSTLSEIEISEGEETIRLSRHISNSPTTHIVPVHTAANLAAAPVADVPAPLAPIAAVPKQAEGHPVKSPMVGTVYLSPSPDAPAFVKVGDTVKIGDPVCIIEAMKMMNRIEADQAGKVVAVLAENGKPVEFDQPLFIIG